MPDSETAEDGVYRCHGTANAVSTLLLTDPVLNQRLREVMKT